MCILTSAKGLYHNMKDWNLNYCGSFKLMEQDKKTALQAFKDYGAKSLYDKLINWDFNFGSFKIEKTDFAEALSAVKMAAGV